MKGQKNTGKKPNLMKNAKILKGIQADEEISNFSDQMRSLLYINC